MKKFVSYIRVSTRRQGQSGLGIEAQEKAVNEYAKGKGEVIATFKEVESGKRKRRPQLLAALAECKRTKATLIVAKLDRLARNVAFISSLMESKIDFIACDQPHANRFTIHILAAVAEFEREMISKRTKEALAAAKARGVKLGTTGKALGKRQSQRAKRFAETMKPIIEQLHNEGFKTLMEKTEELNRRRVPTYWKGKEASMGGERWHISTTHRLVKRS